MSIISNEGIDSSHRAFSQSSPPSAVSQMTLNPLLVSSISQSTYSQDEKIYEGKASKPSLPSPTEGKNPEPIERAAQNIVIGFIEKQLTMLLADISSPQDRLDIFNSLTQGTPLNQSSLKAKAQQTKERLEQKVREETGLVQFSLEALYTPLRSAWIKSLDPLSGGEKLLNAEAIGKARSDLLAKNTESLNQNFLEVIIDALFTQKQVLTEEMLLHSKEILSTMDFKRQDIDVSNKMAAQKSEEVSKAQSRSRKLGVFSKVAMAVGSAISVISLVATIASAGILSPLAMASLAVTGAMLTYSVVDATTGVTAKVFEQFNEIFDDLTAELPDAAAAAVKLAAVVTAVAIIALLVIATAPAGGTAGTSLAMKALTVGAAKTLVLQGSQIAARQLAIQLSLIMLMGSGVLLEFPAELLKATGLSESMQRTFLVLIFLMELLAVMAVAAKATSSTIKSTSSPTGVPTQNEPSYSEQIQALIVSLGSGTKNVAGIIKSAPSALLNEILAVVRDPTLPLKSIKSTTRNILAIPQTFSDLKDLIGTKMAVAMAIDRFLKIFNVGTTTVSQAIQAGYQFSIYTIYKELSETERAEAELKALINSLDSAIQQLQSQTTTASDNSVEFGQAITKLINSISASSTKLYNSLQG